MRKKINFALQGNGADAKSLMYFDEEIDKNRQSLKDKRIIIYGAGIRGCVMLALLVRKGYQNIVFCDNDPVKQYNCINEYEILPFEELINDTNPQVFLISPLEGDTLKDQLQKKGLIRHVDFHYWNAYDYTNFNGFIEEFIRPLKEHVLLVGDYHFSAAVVDDDNKTPLNEMIKERFGASNIKILNMLGANMRTYYNVLKTSFARNDIPRKLILTVNIRTLNSVYSIMKFSQLPVLIEKIYAAHPAPDFELAECLDLAKKRYNRFEEEKLSNSFHTSTSNVDLFFKISYMNPLNETTEGMIYLKRILELMREMQIPTVIFIPPVNYEYGQKRFGDCFLESYNRNIKLMCDFLDLNISDLVHAGLLLKKEEFEAVPPRIAEAVRYRGRAELVKVFENANIQT